MLTSRELTVSLVALAALLSVMPGLSAQDTFGYTATDAVSSSYQNIAGTGAAVLAGTDDGAVTLSIPFAFRFYGISYTSLCVSSNGLIAFGGCVPSDYNNLDLTSQSPGGNLPLMAPFWMDLSFSVPDAGSVVYQTLGSAPSRQFVVQWNNVAALNVPGTLNFQVVLGETNNLILFQYQNVESTAAEVNKGAGSTVGIRDSNGHLNGRRIQWSYRAPVLSNGRSIQFTPPAPAVPVEVTSAVSSTVSAFVYNRLTRLYTGTVTIKNIGPAPINRPISVVLTALTPGVTAMNTSGTAPGLGPYYLAPGTGALAPNASVMIPVAFQNAGTQRITFVVRTFSGSF